MDKKKLLGKRIRELRKRRNINQERLAELIGVEPATISNIENGKNYPSMINLENIMNALGVTFLDVFDFEHADTPQNLIERINQLLNSNPDKVQDFYKIITALTK